MKRSEMKDMIYDMCRKHIRSEGVIDPIQTNILMELPEDILILIEDAGMLPPSISNPNWQGGWNSHTHPAYVNEWEKE